ncbi:MAG: sigma 54-interacting transcriptional regulator [Bacteroidota bacterium]
MDAALSDLGINTWLLENLPYKLMWMDREGRIVYANKMFCKRLGYRPSEITKLTVFDINPTSTSQSWDEHWQEVKKKGVTNFKSVHQTKDGKFYDVEVFAQFFSNNGKNIICSIVSEISESSFYKNLLHHAERMTNVGGWKLNLQDGSLIVTEQTLCIFDSENKEDLLPGNVIHKFEDSEVLKDLLSKAMRNGDAFDIVLALKSGKFVRCVTEPIVKKKKVYKLIGTYQDVTESINKQNKLNTFKDIIDNAQDLIYFRNKSHDFTYGNKAFVNYIRTTIPEYSKILAEDIIGKNEHDFWPNRENADMDGLWNEVQRKGLLEKSIEYHKDGDTLYFQSAVLRANYNGEDIICGITRDVTKQKKDEIELKITLEELSELKNELEIDNQYLREEINSKINFENIVCQSEAYREVLELVTQVAITDATVLITGESGTGKELLASAVHLNSSRKDRSLIKVNCATLPKELIESELFGHKKGAFTGAIADKVGKFSLADGGTIFLDEIGEVPIDLQSKLLRVLQEGEFDALGSEKTTKVDVRVIAATNRDLQEMVRKGTFREDLYYRLNVFPIHNIPLRARKEDIPLLAQFFLEKYSTKAGKSFKRISKKTMALLMEYSFPGNIRELENLIERAVIIENGTTLQPGSWMPSERGMLSSETFKTFEDTQRDYIIEVLNHTNWRVSGPQGAAKILNMKDKTLFAKMKRLGIEKQVGLRR